MTRRVTVEMGVSKMMRTGRRQRAPTRSHQGVAWQRQGKGDQSLDRAGALKRRSKRCSWR